MGGLVRAADPPTGVPTLSGTGGWVLSRSSACPWAATNSLARAENGAATNRHSAERGIRQRGQAVSELVGGDPQPPPSPPAKLLPRVALALLTAIGSQAFLDPLQLVRVHKRDLGGHADRWRGYRWANVRLGRHVINVPLASRQRSRQL